MTSWGHFSRKAYRSLPLLHFLLCRKVLGREHGRVRFALRRKSLRCRAKMAHIRQSRPDSGLKNSPLYLPRKPYTLDPAPEHSTHNLCPRSMPQTCTQHPELQQTCSSQVGTRNPEARTAPAVHRDRARGCISGSGDTLPRRMPGVTLHGVVSPDVQDTPSLKNKAVNFVAKNHPG